MPFYLGIIGRTVQKIKGRPVYGQIFLSLPWKNAEEGFNERKKETKDRETERTATVYDIFLKMSRREKRRVKEKDRNDTGIVLCRVRKISEKELRVGNQFLLFILSRDLSPFSPLFLPFP